ncbi:E3 ubiquitin-protein ligase RNF31-like, partial [Melanerpes formicivorus]|uniref:E3 ubiquitin-protein ligase RNF31-like n=1 Tax=Melanerpes formicivorus TaxID=211600 RepID=UPI00359001C7
ALSLTSCQCWLCPECFKLHFTLGVRERRVLALGCPSCGRPDMADEAQRLSYFSTLDVQLRQCLDPDTYQLFTQKLTELELLKDPKFVWCIQLFESHFGAILRPFWVTFEPLLGHFGAPLASSSRLSRALPNALSATKASAPAASASGTHTTPPSHAPSSGAWLGACDPQVEAVGLEAFLREHSIACPLCGLRFALARGGCLHLQCSQCQHQFCCCCLQPFHPRGRCPEPGCPLWGALHSHHPRDCLFYLRDWEPPRLQALLRDAGVPFETEPPAGIPADGGCPVLEQKEAGAGLKDEACGRETEPGMAGVCRGHYKEYLVALLNERGLDPVPLYSAAELRAAAERHLPAGRAQRGPGESQRAYEERLREELQRHAPVRPRPRLRPAPGPAPR